MHNWIKDNASFCMFVIGTRKTICLLNAFHGWTVKSSQTACTNTRAVCLVRKMLPHHAGAVRGTWFSSNNSKSINVNRFLLTVFSSLASTKTSLWQSRCKSNCQVSTQSESSCLTCWLVNFWQTQADTLEEKKMCCILKREKLRKSLYTEKEQRFVRWFCTFLLFKSGDSKRSHHAQHTHTGLRNHTLFLLDRRTWQTQSCFPA